MGIEKTLVLLKPDAVKMGIVGEILHRFERCGLKVVGMKLVLPSKDFAKNHYLTTDENLAVMGKKTLLDCEKFGVDVKETMGTEDPVKVGTIIWGWNVNFLSSGPVIAIVLEGLHAIENTRNLVGPTIPLNAPAGTIRGDFALDSAVGSNFRKRSLFNLVHSSGNIEEAKREIKLWFRPEELLAYKRIHEDLYSY